MDERKIIIEFAKDGSIKVKPQGFKGQGCHEATRFVEEALGEVTAKEDTAEAFLTAELDAQHLVGR